MIIRILLLLIVMSFWGCCGSVRIGLSAGLTGRSSAISVDGRNAALMAADEINKNGGINGKKLEIVVKNDGNDPEMALTTLENFKKDDIKIVVGPYPSGSAVKIFDYANSNDILILSPTISSQIFMGRNDNFFTFISTSERQGRELAQFALERDKVKKVVLLYEHTNASYSSGVCDSFAGYFKDKGGKVLSKIGYISGNDVSFYKIAGQIMKYEPEGVVSVLPALDNAILLQQLNKVGFRGFVYSGMWANTMDLITNGGDALGNIRVAGMTDINFPGSSWNIFRKNYNKVYKIEPSFASMTTYEVIYLLRDVLAKTGVKDIGKIKRELMKLRDYPGMQQPFSFDENGDVDRDYFMLTVVDGKFVRLK